MIHGAVLIKLWSARNLSRHARLKVIAEVTNEITMIWDVKLVPEDVYNNILLPSSGQKTEAERSS